MTTAEYLQTPETVLPRQLAYGVLRVADSPTVNHQRAVRRLVFALGNHVREMRAGELLFAPMDVVLDSKAHVVVQPDLLFVAHGRGGIVSDRVYGAPDLVVEVLSPHPRIGRLEELVGWYAKYGVRECWLVNLAQRQIVVLQFAGGAVSGRSLHESRENVTSTVLPDISLRPNDVLGWPAI